MKEGTRVLEIGTGWGELALRAAARGATVYSVTLSSEQQELARRRVAEAGYADAVRSSSRTTAPWKASTTPSSRSK